MPAYLPVNRAVGRNDAIEITLHLDLPSQKFLGHLQTQMSPVVLITCILSLSQPVPLSI